MLSFARPVALSVLIATFGCGRSLVFVKLPPISPRASAAGSCPLPPGPAGSDNVDALVATGDRLRDQIPRPLYLAPEADLDEREIEDVIHVDSEKMQGFVNDAYAMWRNAQACYDAATRLDPSNSYAFLNLGFIAIKMSDLVSDPTSRGEFLTRAQTNLIRAKELNRFDGQAIYYDAELQFRRGNYEQATQLLNSLVAKKWNRAHVHNLLGYIAAIQNRHDSAVQSWTLASQLDNPPEATDWALSALRPLNKKRFENDDDDAVPKAYYRWEPTTKKKVLITPPDSPCGWAANGKPRC
jgi:tetratricopeptide (TPR) repeat protein